MAPDLIEDFIAFLYATQPDSTVCPQCGSELESDESGELYCPNCDE